MPGILYWDIYSSQNLHKVFGGTWGASGLLAQMSFAFGSSDTTNWQIKISRLQVIIEILSIIPIALSMTFLSGQNIFIVDMSCIVLEHVVFVHTRGLVSVLALPLLPPAKKKK